MAQNRRKERKYSLQDAVRKTEEEIGEDMRRNSIFTNPDSWPQQKNWGWDR